MSSTEVVKKRGRPKKLAAEEASEPVKKTSSRQKSTKAAVASASRTAAATASPSKPSAVAEKAVTKPTSRPSAKEPSAAEKPPNPIKSPTPPTPSPLKETPADSKILSKVREISAKPFTPDPTSATVKPPPQPPSAAPKPAMAPTPQPPPKIPATKPAPPAAASKIPIAALNSTIVSQLTTRAGARPGAKADGQLPKNYKSTARRVTMALVAMPIVVVTSWVLYQRLVLGEEKKHLVAPGMVKVQREAELARGGVNGAEGKP